MDRKLFIGPLIHANEKGELIIIEQSAILVENGMIKSVTENPEPSNTMAEYVTILKDGQFLIPGFVDGHIHAPQFPNIGIGYDKELLDWLETYTFPLEKKYSNEKFADYIYDAVVKRTLTMGTTTACYFASLHGKSSLILGEKAAKFGQRALVGKVSMNTVRSDNYYETTQDSINNAKQFVSDIAKIASPLVKPIITVRFALSCDMQLMTELGKLGKEIDAHIQTHISENRGEIKAVLEKYKEYPSYTAVYDAAGILTNKTILAHGVHLEDSELAIIKERGTTIIHCPSSNTCLRSGLCDVQRLKRHGVKIGLGTDVSGGQSSCMLNAMRSALEVSWHLAILTPGYQSLDYRDVFYMATLGGASALALHDQIGNLVPGKQFDALVIDLNAPASGLDNLIEYTLEEKLQRLICSGDDRNIIEVYVAGRRVK